MNLLKWKVTENITLDYKWEDTVSCMPSGELKRKQKATWTSIVDTLWLMLRKDLGPSYYLRPVCLQTFQEPTHNSLPQKYIFYFVSATFKFVVLFHTCLLRSAPQHSSISLLCQKPKGKTQQLNKTFWHMSPYLKTTQIMIVALGSSAFNFRELYCL